MRLANLEARLKALFLMTHLLGSVFDEYPGRVEALASYQPHPDLAEPLVSRGFVAS